MTIKPSQLRENIYRILDQVLETGIPVEVERHGRMLRIVPVEPMSKLDRLQPHDYLRCEPDDLVHLDWFAQPLPNEPQPARNQM